MTDEEINRKAREYYGAFDTMLHDWKPVAGFKAGAKYHREQSEAKLKELRDKYLHEKMQLIAAQRIGGTNTVISCNLKMVNNFIEQLNAIIEKP